MKQPVQPSIQSVHLQAPVGGLNTVAAGTVMPEGDCPLLFNMLSGEYGLRVRLGSKEWAGYSGAGSVPSDSTLGRTLIGYHGSASNGSADRFFVVTTSGIWDCSAGYGPSAIATHGVNFAVQTGKAGFGISHAFVTAGGHFLVYCDEENGLYVYTESTDTWAKVTQGADPATQISGVNPANFVFVMSWKSRLWFVEKSSGRVWYMPAGAIFGTATKLDLDRSAQLRSGGDVIGLWSWTLDGGVGIDDHLVAATRGGDVAVYKGSDPASVDTFALVGVWNAGAFVAGRKIATAFGGDLVLLTRSGLRPLSQLVNGGDGAGTYVTDKIGNLFTRMAQERGDLDGWDMFIHPDEHAFMVLVPNPQSYVCDAFAMSLWNRSWSFLRDTSMFATCVWRKKLFFSWAATFSGSVFGALFSCEGHVDFMPAGFLELAASYYRPIQWALTTAFRSAGGKQMKVELIRPTIVSQDGNPSWTANARYNYDLSELASLSANAAGGAGSWDVGLWDSATWQSDLGTTDTRARGSTGVGTDAAITIRGASTGNTVLVAIDVFFQTGGAL